MWSTHKDIREVEEIQAFGKLNESVEEASASAVYESSSDEYEGSDDEDDTCIPVVQNAFALLNTD